MTSMLTPPAVASCAVERIGGADRYEVSAAVSSRTFATARLVFVAGGESFPDALCASAVAGAQNAPVLLVARSTLPDSVAAELRRLAPVTVVVVGGPEAVDATVEAALAPFAHRVTRVGGADRYEVAARLSALAFPSSPPVAVVVSGEVFADALGGSAAAGALGGPVLLVPTDRVPDTVVAELARLRPSRLVVLGGPAAIAEPVVDTLRTIVGDTTRLDGADRFVVSAATSAHAFPRGARTVFIASGSTFPDALSGPAAAIHDRAPVLLVTADAVPAVSRAELARLRPERIVVLGGSHTVSDKVMRDLLDRPGGGTIGG
ncbi:cell wall-binding repeat-containing protein [Herbiconiux sp. CPCC 205716]|uniref:Cell wall-binding repeat-containing protein n=1 Tax=Herbiconiux gentiana TaxID=2970912 RepID=A0ABT2GHY4_9MICO|nr:cell wall-binding repeat-containing protein [Herbiconiux gentiana]MCS5714514.1 cell wall-binding repeat-containing protein [Herbiconiux gentiana]